MHCNVMLRLTLLASMLILIPFPGFSAGVDSGQQYDVSIGWSPTGKQDEDAMWLAYVMARAAYVDSHRSEYAQQTGPIVASFGEEVEGRQKVAQVYSEMRGNDRSLNLTYFNDLALVEANSFIAEYVWSYLRQPHWQEPSGLKLSAFKKWSNANIPGHKPETHGGIAFIQHGTKPPGKP